MTKAIPVLSTLLGAALASNSFFMLALPGAWYFAVPGVTSTSPFNQHFLRSVNDLADREPRRSFLTHNTPGPLPPSIPVFLAQGNADKLVVPRVTLNYRAELCYAGDRVEFDLMPGVGHAFAGRDAPGAAIDWIGDRFEGELSPNSCGQN